jgi:hypothetical protein
MATGSPYIGRGARAKTGKVPRPSRLALFLKALSQPEGHEQRRPLLVQFYLDQDSYQVFLLPLWDGASIDNLKITEAYPIPQTDTLPEILALFNQAVEYARQGYVGRYRGEPPTGVQAEDPKSQTLALEAFSTLVEQIGQVFLQPWQGQLEELAPSDLLL